MVSLAIPPALSWMMIVPGSTMTVMIGRDLGLLGGIEGVVHDLLAHHQRPLIERVPGLVLKLALAAELHQSRDLEGHSRQLRLGFPASGPLGLCHNL